MFYTNKPLSNKSLQRNSLPVFISGCFFVYFFTVLEAINNINENYMFIHYNVGVDKGVGIIIKPQKEK